MGEKVNRLKTTVIKIRQRAASTLDAFSFQYGFLKIKMLCNLHCLKARLRLLCNKYIRQSSLNLVSQYLKLRYIFIFGMAYGKRGFGYTKPVRDKLAFRLILKLSLSLSMDSFSLVAGCASLNTTCCTVDSLWFQSCYQVHMTARK